MAVDAYRDEGWPPPAPAGERIVVTRDGRPVAELTAVWTARLGRAALLKRWRHLPRVDAAGPRHDLDDLLDPEP